MRSRTGVGQYRRLARQCRVGLRAEDRQVDEAGEHDFSSPIWSSTMSSYRRAAPSCTAEQRSACARARVRTDGGATASPGVIRRGPSPFPEPGPEGGDGSVSAPVVAEDRMGPSPRRWERGTGERVARGRARPEVGAGGRPRGSDDPGGYAKGWRDFVATCIYRNQER